ncbi:MAG TPA: Rieske 2Fe-2S domain-containing protein [Candidatus Limiplasma sp.]|nr:Rieske 2Fe-2S domain-containing protein [Candidatus Limiplasma sp.]HRX08382.1 Rieske 2Fe-2S domain-containing protein [Candidatus Limiplasma sp.]
MRYVKAATLDQLPEGGKLKVTVEDKTLLITNIGGDYFAIDNRCPHMGGSLFYGVLNGDTIACPRHKTVFSVKTGAVIENGHIAFIRLKVPDAKSYPVKAEGSDILVGLA